MSMGSGLEAAAINNAKNGQKISANGQNNASSLYGTLSPQLSAMSSNPQGMTPSDMSKVQTSNMQTSGGANAGAVGQGSLLSARTKNSGTADAAIAKSGENASQDLSKANLATQNENQDLKQEQRGEGIKGLQSLYGTNVNQALGGLSASDAALNTADKAKMNSFKNTLIETLESGPNTNTSGHGSQSSTTSGCFLTSACVSFAGLSDECSELMILRKFRDTYMSKIKGGKEMVLDYYANAPRIVQMIDGSHERNRIYEEIFKVIRRCIKAIASGHKKRALSLYANMYLGLKMKFAGEK